MLSPFNALANVHAGARYGALSQQYTPTALAAHAASGRSPDRTIDDQLRHTSCVIGRASYRVIEQSSRSPAFVKQVGTPLGAPKYTTYTVHGAKLRMGLSAFSNSSGQLGVLVLEEGYAPGRLCLVAGTVLNAGAPTTKQDLTDAIGVLISLKLPPATSTSQPNPLDAPSG